MAIKRVIKKEENVNQVNNGGKKIMKKKINKPEVKKEVNKVDNSISTNNKSAKSSLNQIFGLKNNNSSKNSSGYISQEQLVMNLKNNLESEFKDSNLSNDFIKKLLNITSKTIFQTLSENVNNNNKENKLTFGKFIFFIKNNDWRVTKPPKMNNDNGEYCLTSPYIQFTSSTLMKKNDNIYVGDYDYNNEIFIYNNNEISLPELKESGAKTLESYLDINDNNEEEIEETTKKKVVNKPKKKKIVKKEIEEENTIVEAEIVDDEDIENNEEELVEDEIIDLDNLSTSDNEEESNDDNDFDFDEEDELDLSDFEEEDEEE